MLYLMSLLLQEIQRRIGSWQKKMNMVQTLWRKSILLDALSSTCGELWRLRFTSHSFPQNAWANTVYLSVLLLIKCFLYVCRLRWITTLLRMWLSTSCISAFLSTAIAHSLTGLTTTHTCTGENGSRIRQMPVTGLIAELFLGISFLHSSFN